MREKDTHSVVDLRLAAFLKTKGFKLLRIDRGTNGQGTFVFEDRPKREELIMSFLNQEESVEPIAFMETQRNLKGAVRGC